MERLRTGIRSRRPQRVGLALSGGGAKGLAFIPILEYLEQRGLKPVAVAGTSAGALFGGMYASGVAPSRIRRTFGGLTTWEELSMYDVNLKRRGLVKGARVHEFISRHLPVTTFEEMPIPFRAVATDLWRREEVVYSSGNLADAIRASISIPGIFDPFVIDGRVLVDGGAVNPLPYDRLRDLCDFVIAVHLTEHVEVPDEPAVPPLSQTVINGHRIMRDTIVRVKVESDPPDVYYRLQIGGAGMLDFGKFDLIVQQAEDDLDEFARKLDAGLSRRGLLSRFLDQKPGASEPGQRWP